MPGQWLFLVKIAQSHTAARKTSRLFCIQMYWSSVQSYGYRESQYSSSDLLLSGTNVHGTPVDYHSYFVLDVLMSGRVDGCMEHQ